MYIGYLEYEGVEIVNHARTATYATTAGLGLTCAICDTLPLALQHPPYIDPVTDNAPWWDPTTPESARFLGVLALGVIGLDTAPLERSPTQLLHDGAVLGPSRRPHREITVTALLVARDECAASYGISWLSAALRDSQCGQPCRGGQLCFYACCPAGDGNREWRTLFDVGLLEGPAVTSTSRRPGGVILTEVEWSWAAAKPWIFGDDNIISAGRWRTLGVDGEIRIDPEADPCPPEPASCGADPDCDRPPLPPLPPEPRDPCYPLSPYTASRAVFSIPITLMPVWKETVPVIDIRSGDAPLRRIGVRLWINPAGLDCLGVLDPCAACEEITATYLPASSSLRIDGRIQRASIDCPGGEGARRAAATLYGKAGGVFTWPVLEYNGGLCVEVYAAASTISPNSEARVFLVPREDAA